MYKNYYCLSEGHLIAPILVHSYCNHMGFPDIRSLQLMQPTQKKISIGCFVIGLLSWVALVEPMTEPSLYQNDLPWSESV